MTGVNRTQPRRVGDCTVLLGGTNPLALARLRQLAAHHEPTFCCVTLESLVRLAAQAGNRIVAVLDLGSLGPGGACWLAAVHRAMPSAKILGIDRVTDTGRLGRLFALGLHGFLAYDDVEMRLDASLALIVAGHLAFPPRILERMATERRSGNPATRCRQVLTERELQVLEFVRARLSNKEIGSAIGISERTVRFHLNNVFGKLGVDNRHAAADAVAALPTTRAGSPSLPLPVAHDRVGPVADDSYTRG